MLLLSYLGCGFALGLERLLLLLEATEQLPEPTVAADVFLISANHKAHLANLALAEKIRKDFPTLKVHYNAKASGMKSQFKKADKSRAKIALIVGDDELQACQVTLKYLREDKSQRTLDLSELKPVLAEFFVKPVALSVSS